MLKKHFLEQPVFEIRKVYECESRVPSLNLLILFFDCFIHLSAQIGVVIELTNLQFGDTVNERQILHPPLVLF